MRGLNLDGSRPAAGGLPDWFNKLDFTYLSNNWGVGLPPAQDNMTNWPVMAPLLRGEPRWIGIMGSARHEPVHIDALKAEGSPYVKQTGEAREVYGASFLAGDGNTLYAGKYSRDGREKMYAYGVAADGTLTTGKSFEIPKGTQGLMVTGDKFVYSTSLSRDVRSNLYVIDKGATDIDIPSTRCFRSPSMSEGVDDLVGIRRVEEHPLDHCKVVPGGNHGVDPHDYSEPIDLRVDGRQEDEQQVERLADRPCSRVET